MNDFVAFEPNRLDQLAKRLQRLAQVLDGNLDQIKSIVEGLGGHVAGSSKTRYWATAAQDDANDMAFRAQKAWEAYRLEQKRPPFIGPVAHPGTIQLNWAETSQGGRQAAADAQALDAAVKNTDVNASRRQLSSLADSLRRHVNDADYLNTFWKSIKDPGIVGRLARLLHDQDVRQNADEVGRKDAPFPQILSDESKRILAGVAANLAAASRQPNAIPESVKQKLLKPEHGDLWSSAMLFKYGPNGRAWDKDLLADMARSIYDWRGPTRPIPGNSPTASGPGWWNDLLPKGPGSQDFIDPKVLADIDPTCAILDRLAESPDAAWAFMTDPKTGLKYTKLLVGTAPWVTGPDGKTIDLSSHAGAVIKVASHVSHNDRDVETQAAKTAMLNVILAVNDFKNGVGGSEVEIPQCLKHAIVDASLEHVPDLALSAKVDPDNGVERIDGDPRNPYEMRVSRVTIEGFLKTAVNDPADIGRFHGEVLSYLRIMVTQSLKSNARPGVDGAAQLDGLLRKSTNLQRLEEAQDKDFAIGVAKSLLSPAFDKLGKPLLPKADGLPKDMADVVVGLTKDHAKSLVFPQFEASARRANDISYQQEFKVLERMTVEGYIAADRLPNPLSDRIPEARGSVPATYPASFWVNGHVELGTARQRSDWVSYIERHGDTYQQTLNSIRTAFGVPTDVRKGGATD